MSAPECGCRCAVCRRRLFRLLVREPRCPVLPRVCSGQRWASLLLRVQHHWLLLREHTLWLQLQHHGHSRQRWMWERTQCHGTDCLRYAMNERIRTHCVHQDWTERIRTERECFTLEPLCFSSSMCADTTPGQSRLRYQLSLVAVGWFEGSGVLHRVGRGEPWSQRIVHVLWSLLQCPRPGVWNDLYLLRQCCQLTLP